MITSQELLESRKAEAASKLISMGTGTTTPGFRNKTELSFTNIESENYRQYTFPGGEKVRIDAPIMLNVSKNGHRVFDEAGVSHYIPQGWIHLEWKAKEGAPHFVK